MRTFVHLVHLMLFASVSSSTPVYVFRNALYDRPPNLSLVAPSIAAPNENVTVYVHVDDTNRYIKPQPVLVLVSLLHSSNGEIARDGPKTMLSGSFKPFVLEIPDAEENFGQCTLEVTMTTRTKRMVKRTLPVGIKGRNKILMIQTDKPIYKPGETVMGRVLVLTGDMKSAKGEVTVTIQNPKAYTMGKFSNISLNTGVGEFEFPLSSEPVLGMYRVCATYSKDPPQEKRPCFNFEVRRYVFQPVFSCSITPSDTVVGCRTKRICFSVTATYTNTHQNKVKGIVSATVQSTMLQDNTLCNMTRPVTKKIDGTIHVCTGACYSRSLCPNQMEINATVTDYASDTTVQCTGQRSVAVTRVPYTLEIMEERGFTPCHYITVKVFASSVTGTPKYANVSLFGMMYLRSANHCVANQDWGRETSNLKLLGPFYQLTDKNGFATFRICTSCNAVKVTFTARVRGDQGILFSSATSTRVMIWAPERIALTTSENLLHVGSTANITASITASFSLARILDYYVVRRGQIVEHGVCFLRSDRYAYQKHPQVCKVGGLRQTCTISFRVTSSMAPKFTVIVSQKNVAASRVVFNVTRDSSAQVSLKFEEEVVQPGGQATLLIRAPPMSLVGIVAVDRNVYNQEEKNQLTSSKLYEHMNKFDEDKPMPLKSYVCGWKDRCECQCQHAHIALKDCCLRNCIKVPQFCSYFNSLSSYFFASGIQTLDSDSASPTECPKPVPHITNNCCSSFDRFIYYLRESRVHHPWMSSFRHTRASNSVRGSEEREDEKEELEEEEGDHRPETWLWFHLSMGNNDSFVTQRVTVPDTITSWVADAFAVSQSTAMTIASPATLTVFKPFFLTINLPYSVIRGEMAEITLTLFNYKQNNIAVLVDLVVNDTELRIIRSINNRNTLKQRPVEVAAGESTTIKYLLLSLTNGYLPIQATARSEEASDSVVRNLLVEPEGVKQEYSQSSLLCVEEEGDSSPSSSSGDDLSYDLSYSIENKCISEQFNISLPPKFVPNSESAAVSIAANYMGPTINGLEHLLKLPTGCGEQNLMKFSSAVYIARYLDTVGQMNAKTRAKALYFMQTGYQKEMTYQRADGSGAFSVFGNLDGCASVWLTAFVLRIFSQADGLVGMYIDDRVQQDAIGFIEAQQKSDGSFPPVCNVINRDMLECSEGSCSLTAYVTLSLLEAGISPESESVRSALANLSAHCIPSDCSSPFTLALVSYTLSKANSRTPALLTALKLLKLCAITEGKQTHWQSQKSCSDPRDYRCFFRPQSCDIEATAYALLTFVTRGDVAYSSRVARWLIKQRNSRGGFRSTQDTVVALQALSEYATLTAPDYFPSSVSLSAANVNQSITIDSLNQLQVQTVQLPRIPTLVDITVCGTGCLTASLGVTYSAPQPDEAATFEVTATAVRPEKGSCRYQVEVCNRWTRQDSERSNMAVTEITFFSGFHPVHRELKQLWRTSQCMTKKTEFDGRVLSIYFDEVNQTQCCFTVTMKRVSLVRGLRGVPVITYDYYEPDERGGTMLYPRQEC